MAGSAFKPIKFGTDGRRGIIAEDYKFDNVMLDADDPTRIVAVLDWEMATLGDPLMDLGTTLGYWVQADDPERHTGLIVGPTNLSGSMTRREVVDRYAEKTGRDTTDMRFYYCFGLFKIAVIVQQIYARYARGLTRDQRFAAMNAVVVRTADCAMHAIRNPTF